MISLATERMRALGISDQEIKLRLAAMWLPAETMRRVFGWDPDSAR
jgi:hypothetical protein